MYGKLMVIVGQRSRSRSPEVKGHDPDLTMASNEPSHILKIYQYIIARRRSIGFYWDVCSPNGHCRSKVEVKVTRGQRS